MIKYTVLFIMSLFCINNIAATIQGSNDCFQRCRLDKTCMDVFNAYRGCCSVDLSFRAADGSLQYMFDVPCDKMLDFLNQIERCDAIFAYDFKSRKRFHDTDYISSMRIVNFTVSGKNKNGGYNKYQDITGSVKHNRFISLREVTEGIIDMQNELENKDGLPGTKVITKKYGN